MELPGEIMLDLPRLFMLGNRSIVVENYKAVIEMGIDKVRVSTAQGSVVISGKGLHIKEITSEDVLVAGTIASLSLEG